MAKKKPKELKAKPLKKPSPELLENIDFMKKLGMIEMMIELGIDKKKSDKEEKK